MLRSLAPFFTGESNQALTERVAVEVSSRPTRNRAQRSPDRSSRRILTEVTTLSLKVSGLQRVKVQAGLLIT
ncbi:hypothetical protein [Schlesneria sp.]|uniref:hypothetical protein n=1 Tax=Schlesneria sp. TaxID=2762018 RepID=UPI002F23483E